MTWFRVDDGFATSPKVLRIPRSRRLQAVGLWTIAGTWSAQHLTDGRIPFFMLEEWGADVSHGTDLVDAGLWREDGDEYVFHDWVDYQPTRSDVMAAREKERRRKEAYRQKKGGTTGESPATVPTGRPAGQTEVSRVPETSRGRSPDPTRPDPVTSPNGEGARKRGHRIPEPFIVTAEMRAWAAEEVAGVDVDASTRRFVDYWRAESGAKATKKDWVATWRNWLRRDLENGRGRQTFAQQKQSNTIDLIGRMRQEEQHEALAGGGVAGVRELARGA